MRKKKGRAKQEPRYVVHNKEAIPLNRKAFKLEARKLGIKLNEDSQWGFRFFKRKTGVTDDN